jgi:hypothetical protein
VAAWHDGARRMGDGIQPCPGTPAKTLKHRPRDTQVDGHGWVSSDAEITLVFTRGKAEAVMPQCRADLVIKPERKPHTLVKRQRHCRV